ncbi:hypothetical protein BN946_scf184774.g1 [Trametes cinnabarina]|uniref:Uncharacterized protein n=1 Tax=Pycnoporus cinnabarinus TaxID=5643 RepID=A0A060SCR2_PYCCI|nr:hypothetical protein BN946_scf184774.g1 [Trametes cinnabarina]
MMLSVRSGCSEFVKALNPSNRSDQAIVDIRELSKIAEDIKQAFHDIGLHFLEFDNANFQNNEGRVLKLGGCWQVYQIVHLLFIWFVKYAMLILLAFQQFQTMLDKSFDNASTASAFMQQYSEAIMTDVAQASYVSLRGEIQMFVKWLETKAEDVLRTKNESTGLANDVRLLTMTVAESLIQVDAHVMNEINVTTKSSTYSACSSTCSLEDELSIIRGSNKYKQIEYACAYIKQEISNREDRLATLVAKEHLITKYQSPLDQTTLNIENLARKANVVVGIWQYLRSDMIILQQELSLASDPDMLLTALFLKKIKATRELYMKLATLLNMYAQGIRQIEPA